MRQATRQGACALSAAAMATAAAMAGDVTVDFEDVAVAPLTVVDVAPAVQSGDFIFQSEQFLALQRDAMPFIGSNGTTTLHNLVTPVTMVHAGGELFSLKSVDLGEAASFLFTANAVMITGFVDGGLPVMTTVNLDMIHDGIGGLDDLQTVTFDEAWENLTSVQFIATTPGFASNFVVDNVVAGLDEPDSDGDGLPDDVDACPESDMRLNVWVEDVETDVVNVLFEDGCTMADLIAAAAAETKNHGQFVRAVAHMTGDWRQMDVINGRERALLVAAAAMSNRD